jgi:DNA polymerase I
VKGKTWLLLDVNNLVYRAFYAHSSGQMLSYKGNSTAGTFGLLKDVVTLRDRFATDNFVFCFDHGRCVAREAILPSYKYKRRMKTGFGLGTDLKTKENVKREIKHLKNGFLRDMGFRNIFFEDGWEADDIIADLVEQLPVLDDAIIVSGDKDMLQLLDEGKVELYHPMSKEYWTQEAFEEKTGVPVETWGQIMAMTGCRTDDVPGIPGIGEGWALKYFRDGKSLPPKIRTKIECKEGREIANRNRSLVMLPCPLLSSSARKLRKNRVTRESWNRAVKSLGMVSLTGDWL